MDLAEQPIGLSRSFRARADGACVRGMLTYAIDLIPLRSELRLPVPHVCYFLTGMRDHSGEPA